MEKMIVLPTPPIARVDHKSGETRFEQTPRTFVMRKGARRTAGLKVKDIHQNNAQAYGAGETFEADPGLMKHQIERGVVDFAHARHGKGRRVGGIVPGRGYVSESDPETMGDELSGPQDEGASITGEGGSSS